MCAAALARRLCTQSGLGSKPAFDPMMKILPSIVRYANGASRGCPDLAPVEVSNRRVPPSNGPPTTPPLARNSSTMPLLKAFMVSASGISVMVFQAPSVDRLKFEYRDHALSVRLELGKGRDLGGNFGNDVIPLGGRQFARRHVD